MAAEYGNESIDQLKGADRIRKLPNVMLGSNGLDGAKHGFIEILGNALDEALSGHGNKLKVGVKDDGSLYVRDFGRGVPLGWNEKEQAWNHYLIFEEMYAGGKYGKSQDNLRKVTNWDKFNPREWAYLFTVGMHGLGAMATQASSKWFKVISYKAGKALEMDFSEGVALWEQPKEFATDEPDGTYIAWKPDDTVFSDVDIPETWVLSVVKDICYLEDISVEFEGMDGNVRVFEHASLPDFLVNHYNDKDVVTGSVLTHGTDSEGDIYVAISDLAVAAGSGKEKFFHNLIPLKGGTPSQGADAAIADFFRLRGQELGVRFKYDDFHALLDLVVSSKSNKKSYRGQTKDVIDNEFLFENVRQNLAGVLNSSWAKKEDWLVQVVERARVNAELRVSAENHLETLKMVKKVSNKKKAPDDFVTCRSYGKKNSDSELWLLEGKSASGSFRDARDASFQCYLPLRGKSLNLYKASLQKLLDNKEIQSIIQILGCGVDLGIDGLDDFDISKLKVDKIVIGSDADVDGFHIRVLIFLIFLRLFPEILKQGKLYVAETPRYGVFLKNGEEIYCRDETMRDDALGKYGAQVKTIRRFKGLGEMDSHVLRKTTVDPATRNLVQLRVDPEDAEVNAVIDALFGSDTGNRKDIILKGILGETFTDVSGSVEDMLKKINADSNWTEIEITEVEV